eukprot:gene16499-7917_t
MESLHKLIKIRGANRSVATKLEREALELLSEPGEPRDDERICRLETILELLDSKLKELKLFDGQIIDVLEEEEKIDSEVTEANEYEFRISNAIRKIKRKLHPPNPFSPATSTRIRRQLPTTPPSVRRLSLLRTTPITPANPSSDEHDGNGNNSLQSGSSSSSHGNSNSKLPKGKHHSSICERKSNNSGAESMPPNVTAISKEKKSTHVLLQTAKATAVNPSTGEKCSIRILFDNGSQRSYVTEDVVKKLQLKTEMKETLNLNTFGSAEYKSKNCKLVSFQIELNDGQLAVVNALSYPELCSPLPTLVEVNSFPHLQGLELADEVDIGSNDHINVLIGADQYHSIVVGDVIRGENGPVAVKSKLGWVLSGKLESSKISQDNFTSANLCIENPRLTESDKDKELVDTLKAFWEVENTGLDCNKLVDSNETDKFCDIRVQGDRYEVGLPWKPTEPKNMVNNFEQCKTRLNSLHSRLIKDPELMREYDGIFKEQLAQGIIEKVPSSELDNDNVRFMPHFGVIRKDRLRYARLPFGLRPSPAVLGSVLLQHVSSYQEKNPEIVKVLKGLFVDDLSTGGETVDKAYEIYQQSKQVMREGNFNLRKWNSNSQELIERIRKSEGQATTGGSDPKLGEEDQSYVQSCIGLSADNETLQQLSKVRIPRCLINGLSVRSYQIHGFSDASEQAYACVVYLRTEYENGEVDCRIIASKARVAPIKQFSVASVVLGYLLPEGSQSKWFVASGLLQISEFSFVLSSRARRFALISREVRFC